MKKKTLIIILSIISALSAAAGTFFLIRTLHKNKKKYFTVSRTYIEV